MLGSPRPTKDVDGVTGATSYGKMFELEEVLRARGFRNVSEPPTRIGRWIRGDLGGLLKNDHDMESHVIAQFSDRDPLVDDVAERVL